MPTAKLARLALAITLSACSGSKTPTPDGGPGGDGGTQSFCSPACGPGLSCLAGQCTPATCAAQSDCPAGFECTGGFCASGNCSPACTPDQICTNALCVNKNPCGPHETTCGQGSAAYCANPSQDSQNCGGCGIVCPAGEACARASCGPSCLSGELLCNALCVDPQSDGENCGACGAACPSGEVCSNGECAMSCGGKTGTLCGSGQARYCADVFDSPYDCGGCGTTCGQAQFCSQGVCQSRCGGLASQLCDGLCVDLQTDLENCGACGAACSLGQVCYGGQCVATCGYPDVTCGADAGEGGCANLFQDPQNCGSCGHACAIGEYCANGSCATACASGPNAFPCDGICVDTATDPQNCGGCNTPCPEGEVCNGDGTCATLCAAGFTVCGSGSAASCVDLQANPASCGSCGQACAFGVGCIAGSCGAGAPDAGPGAPDGGCSGSCPAGFVCAQAACVSQSCADLDGGAGVGCPAGFACLGGSCVQDVCGGVTCAAGSACGNGSCFPTACGTADCDGGLCSDGTCVSPDCAGVVCPAGQTCAAGSCWPSCTGCSAPSVCVGNVCQAGCTIDGTAVAAGALNPANLCQQCVPALDPGGWTALTDGNACATGICTETGCLAGCAIASTAYAAGTVDPADSCLVCDPSASLTGWSAGNDDQACGTGSFCRGGACLPGCEIGGAFVAPGAPNAANPCQVCAPQSAPDAYSNVADGTACNVFGGQFCAAGQCAAVCFIDGGIFQNGAPDPAAPCMACAPATDPTGFSPAPDFATCTQGCTIPGVGNVAAGTPGPDAGDEVQCCAPSFSQSNWSPQWPQAAFGGGEGVCSVGAVALTGIPGPSFVTASAAGVSVFLNQGNGSYQPPTTYLSGQSLLAAGAGDLSGDGIPDLLAWDTSNELLVLPGFDDGTFGAPTTTAFSTACGPYAVALGFSQRFFPGSSQGAVLALGYDQGANGPLCVIGEGDGGAPEVLQSLKVSNVTTPVNAGGQSVVADLNGDGFDDLAFVSTYGTSEIEVFLNDGNGRLGGEADLLVTEAVQGLGAAPFLGRKTASGAPILDLVSYVATPSFALVVLRNDGNGHFTQVGGSPPAASGPSLVYSLAAGDFNGDGNADAAILDNGATPSLVQIFFGDGAGNLTPGPVFTTHTNGSAGQGLLGGPFGPGGAGGFFAITDPTTVTQFQSVCP